MRLVVLLLAGFLSALAADWPMAGGDPASTNRQPLETILNQKTVGGLTLLWSKHLGRHLSSPVILGRAITHRGFQELVFVTSSDDTVFAIDADLGRTLWNRTLEHKAGQKAELVTPAFEPMPDSDDDDDGPEAAQPLFALSSAGRIFALRTISGEDETPPKQLAADGAIALAIHNQKIEVRRQLTYTAKAGPMLFDVFHGKVQATMAGKRQWSSRLAAVTPPVFANGLLYILTKKSLVVVDARTGQTLFTSAFKGTVKKPATLAVANGHVSFATISGDLYCFGLPIDL